MKTFKILAALLLAVVYVGLSSCGKDDGGKNDNSLLVGTWVTEDEYDKKTFNTDGSGVSVLIDGDKELTDQFTYIFDSKTMMLTVRYIDSKTGKPTETSGKIELNGDVLKIGGLVFYRKK